MAEVKLDELKPNSHKYLQEEENKQMREKIAASSPATEKKAEKVTHGAVTTRKRSLGRRFFDIFVDENVGDVNTYLLYDVLVPAIKENIADLINSAVGMIFFGEATRRVVRRSNGNGTGSKVNYGGYFNGGTRTERMPSYGRSRIAHNFEDVVFETRADAELVLDGMVDILQEYKQVSVADLYDLAGRSTEFTDNNFGWTDLRGARVSGSPARGYIIELPRCITLGR